MKYEAIILFGPPGIGKGTQAPLLRHLGYHHVSTGDYIRSVEQYPEIAAKWLPRLQETREQGSFISDAEVMELLADILPKHFTPGKDKLVLDGVPRTAGQVALVNERMDITGAIELYTNDWRMLVDRLEKRGRGYDKNIARSLERLDEYDTRTKPAIKFYENILARIDAGTREKEKSVEQVHEEIVKALLRFKR